jgi:hypothetical protein
MEDIKKRKIDDQAPDSTNSKLAESPDVLKYKLDAVYRQMLEYKNEVKLLQQRNDRLEQFRHSYQSKMGILLNHIDYLGKDLKFLADRISSAESASDVNVVREQEMENEASTLFEKLVDKDHIDSLDGDVKYLVDSTRSVVLRVCNSIEILRDREKERTEWIKSQGNFK